MLGLSDAYVDLQSRCPPHNYAVSRVLVLTRADFSVKTCTNIFHGNLMTPFGVLVRYLRNERGVSSKELAAELGISEKSLSAIETGRQRPPQGDQFDVLCTCLDLSESERESLNNAAKFSVTQLRIPEAATPQEYRLAHRLMGYLGRLSAKQIAAIDAVLGRREDSNG